MYYLIYSSTGTKPFTDDDLTTILSKSVTNNSRDKITGVLLYHGGSFIQLLEGEEELIHATYKRIIADKRHKDVTTIASGQLEQRNFPEWAMGFKSINAEALKELKGYFEPEIQTPATENDNFSVSLLNAFLRAAKMI
jgi:hypothetical protein